MLNWSTSEQSNKYLQSGQPESKMRECGICSIKSARDVFYFTALFRVDQKEVIVTPSSRKL